MANLDLLVIESGTRKQKLSNASTVDFLSVKVGASALEMKETSGSFDFSAKKLTNLADCISAQDAATMNYVDTTRNKLANNTYFTIRNGANTADVSIFRLNANNAFQLATSIIFNTGGNATVQTLNDTNVASTTATGTLNITSGTNSSTSTGSSGPVQVFSANCSAASGSASTGAANFFSGQVISGSSGASGPAALFSGATTSGASGLARIFSGATTGGASGPINIFSGDVVGGANNSGTITVRSGNIGTGGSGDSGPINIYSGTAQANHNTGAITIYSSPATGTGVSGDMQFASGMALANTGAVRINSADVSASGTGRSGHVYLYSGSPQANYNSGDVYIYASNVSGSGVQGQVSLNGSSINVNSKKITNLADPTSAQDAATRAYVLANSGLGFTTLVKTAAYTAVSRDEIFADTLAVGAFTVTLPVTPIAGDRVKIADYNGNWATANVTLGRNGSNINGAAADYVLNVAGSWVEAVYVDATQGWRILL